MKRIFTAILCLLFLPLGVLSYIAGIARIIIWVGWQEADDFMTKEGNRPKKTRSNVQETEK